MTDTEQRADDVGLTPRQREEVASIAHAEFDAMMREVVRILMEAKENADDNA